MVRSERGVGQQGVHAGLVACLDLAKLEPGRRRCDRMAGVIAVEEGGRDGSGGGGGDNQYLYRARRSGSGRVSRDEMKAKGKKGMSAWAGRIPVKRLVGWDSRYVTAMDTYMWMSARMERKKKESK